MTIKGDATTQTDEIAGTFSRLLRYAHEALAAMKVTGHTVESGSAFNGLLRYARNL